MKLTDLISAIRETKSELGNLQKEIAKLQHRREDLQVLPPPRAELADAVCGWIDARAEKYPAALAAQLSFFIRKPLLTFGHTAADGQVLASESNPIGGNKARPAIVHASHIGGNMASPDMIENSLLYLMGDVAKKAIRKAIEQDMEYPDLVGPPMPQRLAEIERLDKKIAELKNQEKEIVDAMEAAKTTAVS